MSLIPRFDCIYIHDVMYIRTVCMCSVDAVYSLQQSDSECSLLKSGVTAPVLGLVQIVDYEVCSGDFNKPYTIYVILTRWEGEGEEGGGR